MLDSKSCGTSPVRERCPRSTSPTDRIEHTSTVRKAALLHIFFRGCRTIIESDATTRSGTGTIHPRNGPERKQSLTSEQTIDAEAQDETTEQVGELLLLLKQIGLNITKAIEEAGLADIESNRDCLILSTLMQEGPQRPRDLLSGAGMTSGGLTKLLDRLETLHLITREYGHVPGDHRGVAVSLTMAGRAAITVVGQVVEQSLRDDEPKISRALELLEQITPERSGHIDSENSPPAVNDIIRGLAELGEALLHALTTDLQPTGQNSANTTLALWCIGRNGMIRPSHLMEATGLSSGGVSKLLDHLEAAGLIRRVADRLTDGRAVTVDLTERGRQELTTRLVQMSEHLDWLRVTLLRIANMVGIR
jgi:DNA-binding MarR family transcriptional regulator